MIDLSDNIGLRQFFLGKIFVTDSGEVRILENGIHEQTSQYGTTTLVAQNIA